jgi:hypothetical protein
MRACFLGQNICSLGFGIATLQTPPLVMDTPVQEPQEPAPNREPIAWEKDIPTAFAATPVANPPRLVP